MLGLNNKSICKEIDLEMLEIRTRVSKIYLYYKRSIRAVSYYSVLS
jgi:hypothetical protein